MLRTSFKFSTFILSLSIFNFLLFHFPFFKFVFQNIDVGTMNGILLISSLLIMMIAANYLAFYIVFSISHIIGRILLVSFFIINSIALYFIDTYHAIIDESMIGNILNTNYNEARSFFSCKLLVYLILLGILPSIFIVKTKIAVVRIKKFLATVSLGLLCILTFIFVNSSNWLWIDKNSKTLGGLAMPWSYSVNTALFYIHQSKQNEKEILLPKATILDKKKAVIVLVIGESARRKNFSLYGYRKNTNPLLSKMKNLYTFDANSCATYTTAGVKCILEHRSTDKLYEILPNYLYRNNVEVIWRTTNWGEPPIHIRNYQNEENLTKSCEGVGCSYDEILISGLKQQILSSRMDKILVVLHTSTSHGPTYNKKYPSQFEVFKPVCNSVELGKCSKDELINAYDNTIVYTDYLLTEIIKQLTELKSYQSSMIFVSDHGESLGEKNLYMHGMPMSLAPKEQYEIPFIVWVSADSKQVKHERNISQNHVFHSVLNFLDVTSPIYDANMSIFK
ncbi:phosphoethanolamine--lipid A transferase EptA [Chryseobacterium hispalense]|uniref:phosphoethanolamine--lipid A transferase EptA n=1 Tax=Chryseobacterium hispalense TaxID=1453492 RepID=UPI0004937ECC|nr:phosphoethanolamine--lipid A transferase EptA [Chryseobacterium hispalense]